MRPLRLEIQAFGPFATREVIDFTQLADDALFLIHGKTGSGKTTVLDAMCYALYGKTSGDERDGTDMRSHHADDALRTEVLFEFSLGEEHYRVKRVPKQSRPKKRSEGVTTQPAEAEFYRIDAAGQETEALATGSGKVSAAVIERLHFDAEQFRQVVVLPQGRFRDLLAARSDERQKILEALFQTRRYRRVERALKDKARAVKEEAKTLTLQIDVRVEEAARLLRLEDGAPRTDGSLQSAWAALDLRLQQTRESEAAARTREASARTTLELGTQTQKRLSARKDARIALEQLEQQSKLTEQMRTALTLARRAAPLAEIMASAVRTRERADTAATEATAAARSAEVAAERAGQAASTLATEKSPAAEIARVDASKQVLQLESLQQRVAQVAEARAALAQAEGSAAKAEVASAAAVQRLADAEVALTTATQRLSDQKTLAAPHAQLAEVAASSKSRLARHEEWSQACLLAQSASREREADRSSLQIAAQAMAEADAALRVAREERHAARAALLARGLQDNAPCPVCGATDHPAPAQSEAEPPDDARLKIMEADAAKATKLRDRAQAGASASERHAAEAATAVQGFERELGNAATQSREQLESEWRAAEERGRTALEAQAGLGACAAAEKQALADKATAEAAAARTRKAAEQANLAKEGATVEVRTHAKELPEALQTEAALTRALQTARTCSEGLERGLRLAQEADSALAKQAAVEAQAAKAAQTSATQREAERADQASDWEAALKRAEFSDAKAWQAARMEPDSMDGMRSSIATYEQSLSAAKDRAQRATAEAGDAPPPDLEALRSTLEGAAAEVRKFATEASGLDRDAREALRLRTKISKERVACQALEERYGIVGRLAQVADGGNTQRLSFQRFVLASRLDEVLDVASQRLVEMTAGRYALRRREGTDDQRRAGGLEIDVDDNETGRPRPARTLSGGEGFLAALALSLATADVVTSHAGGIRLDAIFVDEGFGSLDDEALDRALKTLLSLHEERRLVGVVSHVAELRERIDVRLEVTRGEVGSHASFVLP